MSDVCGWVDVRAGWRVDVRVGWRVDVRVGWRVDVRVGCRVDVRVGCRVDVRVGRGLGNFDDVRRVLRDESCLVAGAGPPRLGA